MSPTVHPVLGDLDRASAEAILRRNHVGRLAFTFHDRVDIEPIHYIYAHEWLYGRTSSGTKLTTLRHHPWVAFEVDEIESAVEWRSVVIHGTVYFLSPSGSDREREAYATAVELLRTFYPDALTAMDAVPHRNVVFRIHVDDVVGRRSTTQVDEPG
jgi:nitroimidazol reductase NimA-like FMN-containing flavoprotein (pyridoxamine 5'-phosphate oxidase superfamily)